MCICLAYIKKIKTKRNRYMIGKLSITLLLFLFFFVGAEESKAQCKDKMGIFKCSDMFNEEGVSFLNDFTISTKKRKRITDENGEEWEVFLVKNTKYRFALCCYAGIEDIELRLYDKKKNKEINPISSTFQNGEDVPYFDFVCPQSSLYFVSIRFKNKETTGKKLCAIGLLGYAGKVKK